MASKNKIVIIDDDLWANFRARLISRKEGSASNKIRTWIKQYMEKTDEKTENKAQIESENKEGDMF